MKPSFQCHWLLIIYVQKQDGFDLGAQFPHQFGPVAVAEEGNARAFIGSCRMDKMTMNSWKSEDTLFQ